MMMLMFMIMKMIETSAPVQWESYNHCDHHDDDHRDEGEGGDYVHMFIRIETYVLYSF